MKKDATFRELYANPKAKMATVDDLLDSMDENGVDVSVVMGIGWTDFALAIEVNDYIIESVQSHPSRLVGFASVNPIWGVRAISECDRCARAGLKGVGELHPDTQLFDLGNKGTMAPLMEVVQAHNLILTTHSSEPVGHIYHGKGNTKPEVLWRFIQNFPASTIVCSHWGGGLPFYALMPEVLKTLNKVYFDTAASPYLYSAQIFEAVSSLTGSNKILLASDYPLMQTSRIINQVEEAALTNADREAILGGNAAILLGT